MTRDEILNQLNTIILWADECAEMEIDGDLLKGIVAARDLLDIPQPDAETGLMKCDYCNGGGEQKPLFHENNYEPYTCMQSYIEISESSYGKKTSDLCGFMGWRKCLCGL